MNTSVSPSPSPSPSTSVVTGTVTSPSSVVTQATSTTTPPVVFPTFNGTCVPVQYPCNPGSRYVDPCDCTFYYVCRDQMTIVRQSCARGTAFDHTSRSAICRRLSDVVNKGKCSQGSPWTRCTDKYSQADMSKLRSWCTGSGYFTQAPPTRGGDDDSNGGTIAAIVILLILLVVIVVLTVVYVRRKGNPIQHIKQSRFWREVVRREGRHYDDQGDEEYYDDNDSQLSYDDRRSARRSARRSHRDSYAENDNTARDTHRSRKVSNIEDPDWGEDPLEEDEGGAYGYDNPALDPDRDTPPPDTENSPAPPAYPSSDEASQDGHYRARELNEMDNDPDAIVPTLDDSDYVLEEQTVHSQRSQTPPFVELGVEDDDNALDNSFVA